MARRDPWIKFYPDDWVADLELGSCSLAAQGLLMRLMSVMRRSEPPGYLLCNGSTPRPNDIARVLGVAPNSYRAGLQELLDKGVLREDETGVYNRRLRDDLRKREEARAYGKRGGNPCIVNPTLNPTLNPEKDKDKDKEAEADARARARDAAAPDFPHVPQEVYRTIHESWGVLCPPSELIRKIGVELMGGFPVDWMVAAIIEAGDHGGRNWAYLSAIIESWKKEGGPVTDSERTAKAQKVAELQAKLAEMREGK